MENPRIPREGPEFLELTRHMQAVDEEHPQLLDGTATSCMGGLLKKNIFYITKGYYIYT